MIDVKHRLNDPAILSPVGGHFCWRILKRFEAGDKDVGEHEETGPTSVVFVVAAEDASGDDLAEVGACDVHGLVMCLVGLFTHELCAVDEEAVDDRDVVWVVEVIYQRTDNSEVDARRHEHCAVIRIICPSSVHISDAT